MSSARRIIWPYLAIALLVLATNLGVVVYRYVWAEHLPDVLAVSFVAALLLLAGLRARFGSRFPDGVALLLCAVPFLVGVALGGIPKPVDLTWLPFPLTPHEMAAHAFEDFTEPRPAGAAASLALVIAELVLWCRFSAGRPLASSVPIGLLLALPFQIPWLAQLSAGFFWPLSMPALVPGLALVLLPLSLARGGSRTGQVIIGLAFATFFVSVLQHQQLSRDVLGGTNCGPATRLQRLDGGELEYFGSVFLSSFPWAPGLAALLVAGAVLGSRKRLLGPLLAVALVLCLDAAAIARLQEPGEASDDFIPRGGIGEARNVLKLSERVLLDDGGKVLLRNPMLDEGSLAMALLAHSIVGRPQSCWGEQSVSVRLSTLTLDARLSAAHELDIARIARGVGIAVITVVEGEDRSPAGSPLLLRTHLRRITATMNSSDFFLRGDATEGCRIEKKSSRMSLSGNVWGEGWLLELPAP